MPLFHLGEMGFQTQESEGADAPQKMLPGRPFFGLVNY